MSRKFLNYIKIKNELKIENSDVEMFMTLEIE